MADTQGGNGEPGKGVEHAGTYDGFMGAMKWGIVVIAIILILMALFLVR